MQHTPGYMRLAKELVAFDGKQLFEPP
jgi:hypothetical protein